MKIPLFLCCLFFVSCSPLAEEEKMQRAKQALAAGNYDDALMYYQMLYNEHPQSKYRAEALYAKATIHQNHRRDFQTAIHLYRRLANEYPNDTNAPGALFLVGFIYHNELRNLDSARAAYGEFLARYPSSEMVASAQFELANLGKEPGDILSESERKEAAQKKKAK
jgi:TolA-binding protein